MILFATYKNLVQLIHLAALLKHSDLEKNITVVFNKTILKLDLKKKGFRNARN